jgi:hypothetical protein
LSFKEAVNFISQNSKGYFVEYEIIPPPEKIRTRRIFTPIEKWLANKDPDLFAYGVLFEIRIER